MLRTTIKCLGVSTIWVNPLLQEYWAKDKMRKSELCVYCGIKIRKSNNSDSGRSVEHMIPQCAVSIKRSNAKGDFHVCRKCNTQKSQIDDLFGILSRVNLSNESGKEAGLKLAKMASKGNKRVLAMMDNAKKKDEGVVIRLPFKGEDIYKYGVFLTKGEYFKQSGNILDTKKKVVLVQWGGLNLISELQKRYSGMHGNNPFDDLCLNESVENIGQECFIVSEKEGFEFVFFFNRAYALITKVVEYTADNLNLKRKNKLCLIACFSKGETNEFCV
jgi:hypothetical protein